MSGGGGSDNSDSINYQKEESFQQRAEKLRQQMLDEYSASNKAKTSKNSAMQMALKNLQQYGTAPQATASTSANQEFLGV